MSPRRRIGSGTLGVVLTAMGLWILPYQLERGDLLKTLVGGVLALVGLIVLVGAIRGRRVKYVGRIVDFLADLAG